MTSYVIKPQQMCECGRPDCPGLFESKYGRKYHPDCSVYVKKKAEAARAAKIRAEGRDTISKRKIKLSHIGSVDGIRDGQRREPSKDWPARREAIRATYGVKLPEREGAIICH